MNYEEWLHGLDLGTDTFILGGGLLAAVCIFYLFKHYALKRIVVEGNKFLVLLYHRFNRPLQLILLLTVLVIALNQLVEDIDEQIWYQKSYSIAVIIIVTWMAVRGIGLCSDWFLQKFNVSQRDNLKARQIHTQIGVLRRLTIAIVTLIGLASCLMVFEQIRSLGVSLIASAGVAGIVIGFAAQKTIGNFFTGFQIAITQPIRIGDVVIVENEWGVIEEINLTYVVVKIWDLRRLVLPITYFVDHPFQNWTRTTADLLGVVMLYLDYNAPLDKLRAEFDRLLETDEVQKLWDGKVKVIQVVETSENTMHVRALVSAPDAPTAFDLRCLIREKLIVFLQENHPESLPKVRLEPLEQDKPAQRREPDAAYSHK